MRFVGGAVENAIKPITKCWAERQKASAPLTPFSIHFIEGLFGFGFAFLEAGKKKNGIFFFWTLERDNCSGPIGTQ